MVEISYTRQVIQVELIPDIDAALRAAYPDYLGLIYAAERRFLRLQFAELPSEEIQAQAINLVTSTPAMGESVLFDMEVQSLWP